MNFTPPSRDFGGYLFDCDGTVIDSMPIHYAGWDYAAKKVGIALDFPKSLYESLAGTATTKIVEILNEMQGLSMDPLEISEIKREYYLANLDQLTVIPEVADYAKRVAETRPVAIVTGGARKIVTQSLQAVGLLDLFPVIVTYEDVPNGKPAPDMFLLAAEMIGVEPSECLVIEDGVLGIEGADAAGMSSVLLPAL